MLCKVPPDIQSFDLTGHGKPGISAILLGSSACSEGKETRRKRVMGRADSADTETGKHDSESG